MRKHKPSVLFPVSLSNNYMIVKAFSRNILGSINLVYCKKVNLEVPVRLSLQDLLLFLGKEAGEIHLFCDRMLFYPSPLIVDIHSLTISLQHIKLCISLLSSKVCEHTVKDPLLTVITKNFSS